MRAEALDETTYILDCIHLGWMQWAGNSGAESRFRVPRYQDRASLLDDHGDMVCLPDAGSTVPSPQGSPVVTSKALWCCCRRQR